MESLLLGTLSYYGNTINDKIDKKNINDSYDSNIEKKIENIEESQAFTLKNNLKNSPEYFKQFDSLTFDNLSQPTSENIAYTTRSGFNTFLQRDIDFNNGYSEFQNTDMHYNVVPKEEFVHNNMTPFTSRRETFVNLDSNVRKYEQLSGNNPTWKNKKEVDPFFGPVKDMNNVFGLPVMTEQMSQRYNPSLKNNYGNLPFKTDEKIMPGLDGKISAPYAVKRIMPRNIDELRSEINKKVSYKTKPLETIKKGELRSVESKITSYKLPSYREIEFNDLIPNRFYVEAAKKNGEYVHNETERGITDNDYMGGAYNINEGQAPNIDTTNYTPAKRENYLNDFTHAFNAVNTRPVFTNIDSYTNYETDRSEINQELHATGIYNTNLSSYYNDTNNIAKPTIKENNIIQDRNLGINGSIEHKSYIFSHDSILPKTIRETTNYNDIRNTVSTYQSGPLMLVDKAKQTIKETTNISGITNIIPNQQNKHITLADIAKKTIKETTINNKNNSNISSNNQNIHLTLNDNAKQTIKETTILKSYIGNTTTNINVGSTYLNDDAKPTIKQSTLYSYNGNANYNQGSIYIQNDDNAKLTNRETTELNNYIGIVGGNNKEIYSNLQDKIKPTIKETTIDTTLKGQNIITNVTESYVKNDDEAKPTIKETLLHNAPGGRMYKPNEGYYNINDEAKVTIKQTTLLNNYKGSMKTNVNALRIEESESNGCFDDKREKTAVSGRFAGAKSDKIRGDINKETIRFNDKRKIFGYVSNPGTSKNYSVTPMTRKNNSKKTDLKTNTFYYIDPIQISTLNNNPLVNDIYHQKNINFN